MLFIDPLWRRFHLSLPRSIRSILSDVVFTATAVVCDHLGREKTSLAGISIIRISLLFFFAAWATNRSYKTRNYIYVTRAYCDDVVITVRGGKRSSFLLFGENFLSEENQNTQNKKKKKKKKEEKGMQSLACISSRWRSCLAGECERCCWGRSNENTKENTLCCSTGDIFSSISVFFLFFSFFFPLPPHLMHAYSVRTWQQVVLSVRRRV